VHTRPLRCTGVKYLSAASVSGQESCLVTIRSHAKVNTPTFPKLASATVWRRQSSQNPPRSYSRLARTRGRILYEITLTRRIASCSSTLHPLVKRKYNVQNTLATLTLARLNRGGIISQALAKNPRCFLLVLTRRDNEINVQL